MDLNGKFQFWLHSMSRIPARSLLAVALILTSSPAAAQISDLAQLLDEFPRAEYFWQQAEIARQLIAEGNRSAISAMQPHLATEDRRRRCNAAFVLAGLGDEQGVEILIAELRDTEPGSRVIEGLPRPVGLATSNLSGVGRQQVRMDRYFAALLLGELRAEAAVPALIEATRDESINYRAATSLGEIGDARAIPALREMVAAFPEQRVFAGYGLAALGVAEGFAILDDVAVSHEQWTQRRYAVDLLGKTMDPRSTPILLRSLRDEHANVRVSAVRSLAAVGDPAALITLRVALDDYEVTPVNERTTVAAEAEKAIAAIESKNPDVRGQR